MGNIQEGAEVEEAQPHRLNEAEAGRCLHGRFSGAAFSPAKGTMSITGISPNITSCESSSQRQQCLRSHTVYSSKAHGTESAIFLE